MSKKIISNKHNVCPVCNADIEIYNSDVVEDGFYEMWNCPKCKCTGKQYFTFTDHYDVYTEDGETRIDSGSKSLQTRIDEKIAEIQKDYALFCSETLMKENLHTATQLCNHHHLLRFAFAFEVSEHLQNMLDCGEIETYEELDETTVLVLESKNVLNWIIRWYDCQEYCPDITSGTAINDWLFDCLEEYQNAEAN